ncbi:phosphoribosylformylglycinamidine cyclo-ligase [Trifolium repens]|nr:phosphoribosylformylglycinamidine cyclo-ligase [Trifolium repens]
MILGDCTGLSCCYLAVASAKPNSSKSNGSSSAIRHGLCCPTGGYSGVLSMSTLKRGKNTVVAGAGDDEGLTYRGAGVDIDAEALMAPTVIYVKQVLDLVSKGGVKGIAHITGGGFTENIPRVVPKGLGALIYKDSWEVPVVFKWLQEAGNIQDSEMR